jgi:hypothetical protein
MIVLLLRSEMLELVGGSDAGCIGAVIGLSLGLLFGAAVTGGAALAVAGAYAPLLAVVCA